MSENIFLSIGSNIEDRKENIGKALLHLRSILNNLRISRCYETEPKYVTEQPEFLNAVAVGVTHISPVDFLKQIQWIEEELGRDRSVELKNGPRKIDIDIILFGQHTIQSEILTVPHPGLLERKFVLIPLLEIEPLAANPVTNEPYWKALGRLGRQGVYYETLRQYTFGIELNAPVRNG